MKNASSRTVLRFLLLLLGICALNLLTAGAVRAGGLDAWSNGWPDLGLKASLAAPATTEVDEGSDLQLLLSSDITASVAVVIVDAQHRVRLHALHRPDSGDQLVPGTELRYPDLSFGETLYADVPVGKATVWVIASDKTLFTASGEPGMKSGDPADESALVQQLQQAQRRGMVSQILTRPIWIDVVAPAVKEFVSKDDFVSFYAVRTRGVKNADRGFRIGFRKNSAELDDWSQRQLKAVGEGMRSPQLSAFQFEIDGHTDDTGTAEYNMALSRRRADSVRNFLAAQMGVPASRLKTEGFGDTQPAVQTKDEAAREQNRRVVIRRLDGGGP
jgi:outer membrane protein OmpA-like peptidoglycan-associated protein